MTTEAAWASLNAALQDAEPECAGLDLFTADGLSEADRAVCASICARCPVLDLCAEYASAAGVTAGFWAGRLFTPKGPKPTSSTTDAEADTSAPITTEGTP